MKFFVALLAFFFVAGVAEAAVVEGQSSPIVRVVGLLKTLQSEIETDGKTEQQQFDKFACWSEDAITRKTETIDTSKADIEKAEKLILKLAASIAAGETAIKNVDQDIADNVAAQKEAAAEREAQAEAYAASMKENEACQGALAEAIKVLENTGTGSLVEKSHFLGALQQAQIVNAAAGLRKVLENSAAVGSTTADDLGVVRDLVAHPSDFFGSPHAAKPSMSAAQVSLNPFGDYAPRSTRIQGILKGMYDAFTADIAREAAEEAEAVKAYNSLLATRKRELATLTQTKLTTEADTAAGKKLKADTEVTKADAEEELAAAEQFLEDTKKNSMKISSEWAERSRLRTEELMGIKEAIAILSSNSATFDKAATTFVQIASNSGTHANEKTAQNLEKAYQQLTKLATNLHSMQLGEIAADLKLGGHFDKVIVAIDNMMVLLRKEEAADIFHRDRCESANNANTNEISDLEHDIGKNDAAMDKMNNKISELQTSIGDNQDKAKSIKADMATALNMRNDAHAEFVEALKTDTDAIELIEQAIVSLSKYYTNNKLVMPGLLQGDPEYSVSKDAMPEIEFAKATKRSSESGGIVAILSMIKEDLEKEVKTAKQEDAAAEAAYEETRAAMQAELDATEAGIATMEGEKASTQSDLADADEVGISKKEDLENEKDAKATLYQDCSWVKTHFDSRYKKRKDEMKGLTEAKAYLAGIGDKAL